MGNEDYGREGEQERPWEGDAQEAFGNDAEAEQLVLDSGDEQLPWLESDEDYEEEGVDTARVIAIGLVGLLFIAVIVGGIWWFTRDRGEGALVADGSTIEAPEGPVKTRPEDPGGKTFEGTGDTSFAVGEGQTREGVLATDVAPRPSVEAALPESVPAEAEPAPASSGVGVQVGAYSTRARAEQGWTTLVRQHSVLQGVPHRVIEGQADIGRVFRLQAVASDRAAADSMCARIRAGGGACQVKP